MNFRWTTAALSLLSLGLGAVETRAEGPGEPFRVIWSAATGVRPDEATPVWQLWGGNSIRKGKGSDELQDGLLTMQVPGKEQIDGAKVISRTYLRYWKPGVGGGGVTAEFSLKIGAVAPECTTAASFGFSTGTLVFRFSLDPEGIYTSDKEFVPLDTSRLRVYRITHETDTAEARLYVDGNPEPVAVVRGIDSSIPANVYFGALFEATGGTSLWSYAAFTDQGVYPPEN